MIWEFVATISAGLGAAGIMMMIRLFVKKLPKWLVPAAAGLGMIGFQVYSEYTWFDHTRSLLPASAMVVAEVPESTFYKPWSYVKPQVLKFVAIDSTKTASVGESGQVLQTNLYFFERRMSAQTWPILINCQTRLQANAPQQNNGEPLSVDADAWSKTDYSEKIALAICPKP